MFDESDLEKTRAAWQRQSESAEQLSTALLRSRTTTINALMRRAKFAIVVGGSLAVPVCGWLMYNFPAPLQRLGVAILFAAVALQIHHVWHLAVGTRGDAGTVNALPSVVAYRAMLDRQRQFHGGSNAWVRLIALSAAFLSFLAGVAQVDGLDRDTVIFAAICVALAVGVFVNGRVQAGRYRSEIEEVDQLQAETRGAASM